MTSVFQIACFMGFVLLLHHEESGKKTYLSPYPLGLLLLFAKY